MSQEWMLDLLTDLRVVAENNAMYDLAEHLDDALLLAAREIRQSKACSTLAGVDHDLGGDISREAPECENA